MTAASIRLRVLAVAGLVSLALGTVVLAAAPQAGTEKHVIVTVLDAQTNKPVIGLPANAFAIREDNLDREIVKVEPATDPMSVVLLADTTTAFINRARDLRVSSQAFIKQFLAVHPGSSLALWEFGGADIPIVDFTTDAATLGAAAGSKLFPKGSQNGINRAGSGSTLSGADIVASNLLEAIVSSSRQLAKRPEARRVIVAFNSDLSVEASTLPGQTVEDEVQKADATLFAVSLTEIASNGPRRDNVLNQLCPYSGGKRFTIQDIAALDGALKNVADILASQYVVTYRRPSGSVKQVLVGTTRQGLKASTARWAPR
jgi:hypothetical protein